MNGNGKALWVAVVGVMLTLAGIIWQGGTTTGQVREQIDSLQDSMEQIEKRQRNIADIVVSQAKGASEREDLQRQIDLLRKQINRLQGDDTGPHQQTTGDTDG